MSSKDIGGATMAIAFSAFVRALAMQPGIDVKKLTADISSVLLGMETAAEQDSNENLVKAARAILRTQLPDLPVG